MLALKLNHSDEVCDFCFPASGLLPSLGSNDGYCVPVGNLMYMCMFGVFLSIQVESYPACLACGMGSVCQCMQIYLALEPLCVVFHTRSSILSLLGVHSVSDVANRNSLALNLTEFEHVFLVHMHECCTPGWTLRH